MRRPVCAVCLVFAAVIAVLQGIWGMPAPFYDGADGEIVTVTGRVCRKETERSVFYGEEQILYLKDISSVQFQNVNWKAEHTEGVVCRLQPGKHADKDVHADRDVHADKDVPKMGSIVTVEGKLKPFQRTRVPGGFDQAEYYRIAGYSFRIQKARVLEESLDYDKIGEALERLRAYLGQSFEAVLGEAEASVLMAMLLGEKKELDQDTKKLYQEASISHILCISGLHITFLGMGMYRLCRRTPLPHAVSVLFCIGIMYCYGRMTGQGTSTVRAVFMFSLSLLARLLGRSYDLLTALSLAAVGILVEQPFYLWNSGFLLSFGAVMGMALLTPMLQEHIPKAVAGGLGVFLATLPVLIQFFYEAAPYSLLLNLAVIPLSAMLLPAGLLIPVLYGLCQPLACIPGSVCQVILIIYEKAGKLSLMLPGSRWTIGHVRMEQIVVYYMILTAVVILAKRYRKQLSGGMLILLLMGALAVLTARTGREGLQVTMLDVGQGDCFLIRSGNTEILVDGGSSSEKDTGSWQILPALKYYGIRELDYILLSHTDEDHVNGIVQLLKDGEIRCRVLGLPETAQLQDREGETAYAQIVDAAFFQSGNRPVVCCMAAGDCIREKDVMVTCLHPVEGEVMEDANSTSMVLWLCSEGVEFLFTGDLPGDKEEQVLQELERQRRLNPDICHTANPLILKAAHHGSNGSTTEAFLQELKPILTLISCGENNSYGHPGKDMIKRTKESGSRIFVTAWEGSCEVNAERGKVWLMNGRTLYGKKMPEKRKCLEE